MSFQVSLYCTNTLFAKSRMLFLPRPGLNRDRGAGGGGVSRDRVRRWLAVAAALLPVQHGGGGDWRNAAESLGKLNKSSNLPCRSGLSCSVV